MGGTNPIFIAALLTASVGMSQAGENDPFIYFATQDPFVSPEAPITKNDVHLFGGVCRLAFKCKNAVVLPELGT